MIRVGPAGWSYADWEGVVYPREKPRGFRALPFLARSFDLVELNASFYRTPRRRDVERWVADVEPFERFRFTAKLHQSFTHGTWREDEEPELARVFAEQKQALAPLLEAGRLSALLAQFPISFRASDAGLRRLAWLAERVRSVPLVVELRHRTWYAESRLRDLRALGVSVAWIDLPAARDHPPDEPPVLGSLGYLRIHGRNAKAWFDARAGRDDRYDYLYDADEVRTLARRIERLATRVDEVAVVTNNHFAGKAVANGLELLTELGEPAPLAPASLVETYPRLAGRVRPDGQAGLFG